jgi:hypothetical protein
VLITEFGTDSWNATVARVDETLQSDTDAALWREIAILSSATAWANPPAIGGVVMAWVDEWWKSRQQPAVQDAGGFPLVRTIFHPVTGLPMAAFQGHPDGFSNEEHYGLVDAARRKKAAFLALQQAFASAPAAPSQVTLTVTSAGNGAAGFTVIGKNGAPLYANARPGITMGVVSRASGLVLALHRFDTASDPAGQCAALNRMVRTLSSREVVLAGVAGSGIPSGGSIHDPGLRACVDALQALGAARIIEIGPDEPWALIAVAGSAAVNLSEGAGAPSETVHLSADVSLTGL